MKNEAGSSCQLTIDVILTIVVYLLGFSATFSVKAAHREKSRKGVRGPDDSNNPHYYVRVSANGYKFGIIQNGVCQTA